MISASDHDELGVDLVEEVVSRDPLPLPLPLVEGGVGISSEDGVEAGG